MPSLAVVPGDCLVPDHSIIDDDTHVFMAETDGLCTQHRYHKQKITFFLAAMRAHRDKLRSHGITVHYHELDEHRSTYRELLDAHLERHEYDEIRTYTPSDTSFSAPRRVAETHGVSYREDNNPTFLTPRRRLTDWADTNDYYHASFYKWQRRRLNILIDEDGSPHKDKWSFDQENRDRLDNTAKVPSLPSIDHTQHVQDVKDLVAERFDTHPGSLGDYWLPTTHEQAMSWYRAFLDQRFDDFGPYQDAINKDQDVAYHAAISPLLNAGLLTPEYVVSQALQAYEDNDIKYQSVEGFIRQIIGWREFMRLVYLDADLHGANIFDHDGSLAEAWWTGETGLPPVDDAIEQAQRTGYCHHIQRLMILSNAMLLSEVHPDEAYTWFMELFVDSAEWVMEPNVYGMGQYAGGGVFATKPYISSSNYILKMSDYDRGTWCDEWDALYWSFLNRHEEILRDNARMGLMLSHLDRKDEEEIRDIEERAATVRERLTR